MEYTGVLYDENAPDNKGQQYENSSMTQGGESAYLVLDSTRASAVEISKLELASVKSFAVRIARVPLSQADL